MHIKSLYICIFGRIMKSIVFILLLISALGVHAQPEKPSSLDQSPLDISYYPADYGILKISGKAPAMPVMRVIYSRPHVNGRIIFGGLVEYGEIWRLGANEATEIEFFRDVKIHNKIVKKGRYTMYAIPYPGKWTLIINRETDTWGAFKYNRTKDVLRTNIPVIQNDATEDMTIYFTKANYGATMKILWENAEVNVPINF